MNPPARHYDPLTVRLHWATAALVLLLWSSAQVIDWFPKGPPRWNMRTVHMLLGVALALVLIRRVHWRLTVGRRLPPPGSAFARHAAKTGHGLLYGLLITAVVLGLFNAWVRGDRVFDWFQIPAFASGSTALRHDVGAWHEWAANAILVLAGLHAAVALFHHHVLRDGLLNRMSLRPSPEEDPANLAGLIPPSSADAHSPSAHRS